MDAKLTFQYDKIGDILYIHACPPYPDQDSEELADDIIVRLNPKTRHVEGLELLFFSTRLRDKQVFELPVLADLQLA